MSRIGFLGLGTMGRGMVANLMQAGHEVSVWNRTPGRADELTAKGAKEAPTPQDAVAGAEFVMYCLADDEAVQHLVHGEDGLAVTAPEGALVVDLSTVDPETTAASHEAYAARGVRFLDAPVFGSKGEAAAGGLWIVVGGDEEDLRRASPVLEPLAASIHHMGPVGAGTTMKLVGNLIVAAQLEALGESLTLAKRAGLDLERVLDVVRVTDFRSPIFEGVGPAVLRDDYTTNFSLRLMQKDAHLIGALTERLDLDLPGLDATTRTIERAVDAGHGDENASALIKVLAADAGVSLAEPDDDEGA